MDIFFHANVTIASMDDDQLQLRSNLLALVGIIRKHNPAKRFGPVQDLVGAYGTGAVFAGNLIAAGQSAHDSFGVTLKFMSELHSVLNIKLCMDRGYSGTQNVNAAAKAGGRHVGCVIKTFTPFKPIDEKHPAAASLFHVSEAGIASAYYCEYKLPCGTCMVLACFRNGSNKLVHMESAKEDFKAFSYEWQHSSGAGSVG